jgi:NADPH:quinone reductase-like Zn-dependent oxidoreductase
VGGFASYFICNERWAHPLPANVTYEEGAHFVFWLTHNNFFYMPICI